MKIAFIICRTFNIPLTDNLKGGVISHLVVDFLFDNLYFRKNIYPFAR